MVSSADGEGEAMRQSQGWRMAVQPHLTGLWYIKGHFKAVCKTVQTVL